MPFRLLKELHHLADRRLRRHHERRVRPHRDPVRRRFGARPVELHVLAHDDLNAALAGSSRSRSDRLHRRPARRVRRRSRAARPSRRPGCTASSRPRAPCCRDFRRACLGGLLLTRPSAGAGATPMRAEERAQRHDDSRRDGSCAGAVSARPCEQQSTSTHEGNLDNKELVAGTTLYIPMLRARRASRGRRRTCPRAR